MPTLPAGPLLISKAARSSHESRSSHGPALSTATAPTASVAPGAAVQLGPAPRRAVRPRPAPLRRMLTCSDLRGTEARCGATGEPAARRRRAAPTDAQVETLVIETAQAEGTGAEGGR